MENQTPNKDILSELKFANSHSQILKGQLLKVFGTESINSMYFRYFLSTTSKKGDCHIVPYLPNFENMPNKIKDLTEQQCDNLMILGDPKNYAYPDINQQNLNIFLNQSVEYLPYDINIEKPDVRSRFKLAMWNIKEKEKQIFIFYRRTQN